MLSDISKHKINKPTYAALYNQKMGGPGEMALWLRAHAAPAEDWAGCPFPALAR